MAPVPWIPAPFQPICSLFGYRQETSLGTELQKEADWTVANANLACFLQAGKSPFPALGSPENNVPNKVISYEHPSMGWFLYRLSRKFLSLNLGLNIPSWGLPGSSAGKNPPAMQETPVQFLVQEDPLEKGWATHSSILGLPLVAQMVKNPPAMQETWVQSLCWEDPLEDNMATHSSILVWRIPMDNGTRRATVRGVVKSWTRVTD